ncbi:MAG: SDR family oxidoreductase [Peptococcaceae bacterium]|nr:SDR family oxidoreductase [Peptococcaceae bacterium]
MSDNNKRVLVLGISGMLGSALFRAYSGDPDLLTFGTVRNESDLVYFNPKLHERIIANIFIENELNLLSAFSKSRPTVVINCIGIIKQLPTAHDHIQSIVTNSLWPHRLAKYCYAFGAKLIHISTDCVFSGKYGRYKEDDLPDASDLYGRTKLIGEVTYKNTITLRTSIIGHELKHAMSLVDWFLSQKNTVRGFTNAIFSGLPTTEVARVIKEYVIPYDSLNGLYHLSVDPINKFDLLSLIGHVYGHEIKIVPDDELKIDRSLDSSRFQMATGFNPKPWSLMINEMHEQFLLSGQQ